MSRYEADPYDDPRRSLASLRYDSDLYSPSTAERSPTKVELKLRAQRGSVNLNLGDAFIGDEGCEALAAHLKEHPEIASLDLKGNNITTAGLRLLTSALRSSRLRSLSLEWNSIGNDTEALTEAFGFSESLQHLDLRNNRIGAVGAEHLSKLISLNKSIVTLDLRWNELGAQGASTLLGALQGRHFVRSVEVSGNRIPDDLLTQFEDLSQSPSALQSQRSPRYPSPRNFSPRYASPRRTSRQSPLRSSAPVEPLIPVKLLSREQEFSDELQVKYEAQLLALTRAESRISELELMLDQEVKRSQDARQEILREHEDERYQRSRAEESVLIIKEESLKREMDESKAAQEQELRFNRVQSEKTMLNNELERLKASYDQFQASSAERLRALDDRLAQQQKNYRQLEETSRLNADRARDDHIAEVRDVSQNYEAKLAVAHSQADELSKDKESLELTLQGFKNQIFDLKSLHAEELVRTEDRVREAEGIKFNTALKSLEARMKAGEESREQLSRRFQDLQRELSRTEQKAEETSRDLETQLSQEIDDRNEVTRQLHSTNASLDSTRTDLHQTKATLERLQIEKEELTRTLVQRKDQHTKLVEKLYSDQGVERRQSEQNRKELETRIGELEVQLSETEAQRDHFLNSHTRLAELLKVELSQCIQETVLAHVQKLEASTYR